MVGMFPQFDPHQSSSLKSPSHIGEGNNKKTATLIITAISRTLKMKPLLLFKGGGQVDTVLLSNAALTHRRLPGKNATVVITDHATVYEASTAEECVPLVQPGDLDFLISDSRNRHLTDTVKAVLLECATACGVIPKVRMWLF